MNDNAPQIAALTSLLATMPADDPLRPSLESRMQHLRAQAELVVNPLQQSYVGGDTVLHDKIGGDRIEGDKTQGITEVHAPLRGTAVGVNQGTIQVFFGTTPPTDAKEFLDSYLESLIHTYGHLRLGKLLGREQTGRERPAVPTLQLRAVYTALVTDGRLAGTTFRRSAKQLRDVLDKGDPRQVLPDQVLLPVLRTAVGPERATTLHRDTEMVAHGRLTENWLAAIRALPHDQGEKKLAGRWYHPELAIAALAEPQARVILLGDPGGGKSTVLRYLVVALAEALLAGHERGLDIPGWQTQELPIPLFCQLGKLATQLGDNPARDVETLVTALLQSVLGGEIRQVLRDQVLIAWRRGDVLLCLDGLDEVSPMLTAVNGGQRSPRERIAEAISRLAVQLGRARLVVTCRTRPYRQDTAWQFPTPWQTRIIEPFAFGQSRHFVRTWYSQTCAQPEAKYRPEEAEERAARLIAAIERSPGLQPIAENPLLLTMLTLLHYNQKQLPEERAEVYEELVKLLLDRWEGVRSEEKERRGETFGERLGLPHLRTEQLRPALHELAFAAHTTTIDGRGVISQALLEQVLLPFFRRQLDPDNPGQVKRSTCIAKIERLTELLLAETGIVQPEGDDSFVLPHLTFEEYLASCYLADQEDTALAYTRWREGRDRWREPLLLLMGRLRQQTKFNQSISWLEQLLDTEFERVAKSTAQRQGDVVFAAACYRDLGERGYLLSRWSEQKTDAFETRLRAALIEVLEQPDPQTLLPQRVEAGTALGRLGDPRYPVTVEDWQREVNRRNEIFGQPAGYLCYIPAGSYTIGGWTLGQDSADIRMAPFWIGRFPITVAQYARFVAENESPGAVRWWTPQGWEWKSAQNDPATPDYEAMRSINQPVVGVTWYEVVAFCAWLSAELNDILPTGYVVRLPTEAEWEIAAAYDAQGNRRSYPWGTAELTPEYAIYDKSRLRRPVPVGCCSLGIAASGILDAIGNVWEWCVSSYKAYPAQSHIVQEDFANGKPDIPWRGGSWYQSETYLRCDARFSYPPTNVVINDYGFRIVVAPGSPGACEE